MSLEEDVKKILQVPSKATEGDENPNLESELGVFLVKKGYIRSIEEQAHSWGFIYSSSAKKIYISREWMPKEKWEHCIFRLGMNKETNENFYPERGEETKKYRFLHEVSHAYQELLFSKESLDDSKLWHEKALNGEINSCFSSLFNFCFQKREEETKRGLSIWGNAPQYDHLQDEKIPNRVSEIAVRAQEDANELVTMYIWHPEYFQSFIEHLLTSSEKKLKEECFIKLSEKEGDYLKEIIKQYVEEMKKEIDFKVERKSD